MASAGKDDARQLAEGIWRRHTNRNTDPRLGEWRDPWRYAWLLSLIVPGVTFWSWIWVMVTGLHVFWWSGLALIFIVIPMLDCVIGPRAQNPPDSAMSGLQNDRFYRWTTYLFLPGQFGSLAFACWIWSGGGFIAVSVVDKVGLMLTIGTVGGIAINTAHELGHKRERLEKWLSRFALAQTCYGHFFVEHNHGHHIRVATPNDPASSRLGETVYEFVPRSTVGGMRSAWKIETARLARAGQPTWSFGNNVLNAWFISLMLFALLTTWFGMCTLPWLIGQAVVGFTLLEMVNYIEHYGLRRAMLPDGRYERVRPAHSWNSNSIVSNIFLFQLQRHSDHHANPLRRYQTLRHWDEAPQLPAGYGAMLLLALAPPLWRHVMDHRVLALYEGDVSRAAVHPRQRQRLEMRWPPPV